MHRQPPFVGSDLQLSPYALPWGMQYDPTMPQSVWGYSLPPHFWGGSASAGPYMPAGYGAGSAEPPLHFASGRTPSSTPPATAAAAVGPSQLPTPLHSDLKAVTTSESEHDVQTAPASTTNKSRASVGQLLEEEEPFQKSMMDIFNDTESQLFQFHLSKAETVILHAINRIFPDAVFAKVRPAFLTNPKTKRRLELDLYCESLKCGIERNGVQHYCYPNGIHSSRESFLALQERDKLKADLCKRNGVTLLCVPFTVAAKDTEAFLREELQRLCFVAPTTRMHNRQRDL